jgi:hypothetical protein
MVVAILTGHVQVRRHLYIMGLFNGDPTCRFCRMETETVQHMIYFLTAIGLTPGGSCTVHIYTQTTENDTKQTIRRTTQK